MTAAHRSGPTGLVILGPPGTGKTSWLIGAIRDEIGGGVPSDRISFVTFTKAARNEAVTRISKDLGIPPGSLPWFRTIHATAYRLLDLRPPDVMGDRAWQEFGERYGYEFTGAAIAIEDPLCEFPRQTEADVLRYAYYWGRNRMLDTDRTMSRFPVAVSAVQFPLFVSRLVRFKDERGLQDFCDMLDRVLERGVGPQVDVLVVDEAQDLSPLQIAVVERWIAPCSRAYVAGDDDQAIYAFQGADPSWLHGLAERWPIEILQQSHRVPAAVFALAQRVIGRNRARIEKVYRPTDLCGLVEQIEPEEVPRILESDTDTFVLARNREFLRPVAGALFERSVPYVVEGSGGISPLSNPDLVRAVRTSTAIFCKQPVDARDLEVLLKFIPSRGCDLLPHGVKQRVKEREGQIPPETMSVELGLVKLVEQFRLKGPVEPLVKLPTSERSYLEALLLRYGEIPESGIRLTTIHGAKGREADTVVIIPDMSRATYAEYTEYSRGGFEAENRVAYVAVTRAKRRLILVKPKTRRYYDYPDLGARRERQDPREDASAPIWP